MDFEQAKALPFLDAWIFVEGQRVLSYEEFMQLASQEQYRHKETLEIAVIKAVSGG